MKMWTLSIRTVCAFIAYVVSYVLLYYTPLYQDLVYSVGSQVRVFIIINVIVLILVGIAYKHILTMVNIVCMVFCTPSIMASSKLIKQVLGTKPTQYLFPHFTALLFLIVIVLMLAARRLERLEKESDEILTGGAQRDDVSFIWVSSIKVYSVFLALVSLICLILIAFGFVALQMNASKLIILLTAVTGIALILGCVVFLYRRWVKNNVITKK